MPPVPGPRPPSPEKVITISSDHPSEAAVTTYHSDATGTEPAAISLPSIGASGFIQKVGVDQYHQVGVPSNIHLAGWFVKTTTPGDPGLSIIDGHVDGYRQPGIFASLAQLKVGDTFTVTLANTAVRHFRVASVQSLPTAQAASALFSQAPGIIRELNLITCGGTFKGSTGYDHRIVVSARLVR